MIFDVLRIDLAMQKGTFFLGPSWIAPLFLSFVVFSFFVLSFSLFFITFALLLRRLCVVIAMRRVMS